MKNKPKIYIKNWTAQKRQLQSARLANQRQSDSYIQAVSDSLAKRWADPEYRGRAAQRAREQYKDPFFRSNMSKGMKERSEKRWADPQEKIKLSCQSKKFWSNPLNRKRHSEQAKAKWAERKAAKL